MNIFLDLETYSDVPIKYGAFRYAEEAEILLIGWAIDDSPAHVWDLTADKQCPAELSKALANPESVTIWHNGLNFDNTVCGCLRPTLPVGLFRNPAKGEKIIDTMILAYEAGLPGSLDQLSQVFKLGDKAKDRRGKALVRLFCQPRGNSRLTSADRPEEWKEFVEYCRQDIVALREIFKKIPKTNFRLPFEQELQRVDWQINVRGIPIDIDLARAAVKADAQDKAELNAKVQAKTEGAVTSATQRQALIDYIFAQHGWKITDMTKTEVEKRISDDSIPEPVRELLALRLATAKTSVKKYETLLNVTNLDCRLRGAMQFRGAARTGRWAGRLFQVQNLARPSLKEAEVQKAVEAIKAGKVNELYDNVGEVLSSCLRSAIRAPRGKKLIDADFSSVESRVLAWLADEEWKLKAFADLDAGMGHDPYQHAYAMTFNVPVESVTKKQRQMGKPIELGMGFGGGVGAFVTFARAYGIDLDSIGDQVEASISRDVWNTAADKWAWAEEQKMTLDLPEKTWVACEAIKTKWRLDNPSIVSFWDACAKGCQKAIHSPGQVFAIGKHLKARMYGRYLQLRLPSGRCLFYPLPKDGSRADALSYMGVNQYTRKWERIQTFGGRIAENATQAVACDLLGCALIRLNANDYRPVMHIHDEIVCEVPDSPKYSVAEVEQIMAQVPEWAQGLPLAAAGWEGPCFKKD